MLRTITLSNFKILFHEFEKNRDHNIIISFTPRTQEEEIWGIGNSTTKLILPYALGIVDTTINDKEYTCTVLFDDESKGKPKTLFSFFTKKLEKELKEISTQESNTMYQIAADKSIKTEYRQISSPNGDSSITISDDVVKIKSGDVEFTVSKQQITNACKEVNLGLPEESKGGLYKETGMFRFLPNFFLPPFNLPQYLPDVALVFLVAKKLNVIKNLINSLENKNV